MSGTFWHLISIPSLGRYGSAGDGVLGVGHRARRKSWQESGRGGAREHPPESCQEVSRNLCVARGKIYRLRGALLLPASGCVSRLFQTLHHLLSLRRQERTHFGHEYEHVEKMRATLDSVDSIISYFSKPPVHHRSAVTIGPAELGDDCGVWPRQTRAYWVDYFHAEIEVTP